MFIATPMYGGMAAGQYTKSMIDLSTWFGQHNLTKLSYFLFSDSMVCRARNICVEAFLNSGAEHLLFIDADMAFDPKDVLTLWAIADNYDVIGGIYPRKVIDWPNIVKAVLKGLGKGDPSKLAKYVGSLIFTALKPETVNLANPFEVLNLGTGFMMIKRETILKLKDKVPYARTGMDNLVETPNIGLFFDRDISTGDYLGEDHGFCHLVRQNGMKIWAAPWIRLKHIGGFTFDSSLIDIARLS